MEGGSESRSNFKRPYNRQAAGSASRYAGFKELEIRHLQQNPLDAEIDDFAFDLYNSDDDDDQDDKERNQ